MSLTERLAFIASIILPLWNIPLIVRVVQRKSSDDISLSWVLGVWTCFVFMLPDGLSSDDIVWRTFNISNMTMFTIVVLVVLKYRLQKNK